MSGTPERDEDDLARKLAAFEAWAEQVQPEDLVEVDTESLNRLRQLREHRARVDEAILEAVRDARTAGFSWARISHFLGVSRQAAQQKYGPLIAGVDAR